MAKRGPKPLWSDEEKAEVIAHVLVNVAAGRFVSRILREDRTTASGVSVPSATTFWLWVFQDDTNELSDKLARAREFGVEVLLDEATDIADEAVYDTVKDDNGNERANSEWISRSRLRVETRIKLAQLLKPRKYGAKVDLTSGGKPIGYGDRLLEAQRRLDALEGGGIQRLLAPPDRGGTDDA
jgi:hypothetical protein